MDRNEKDMARSGLDKLLTRIEYKTPVNSRIEEIGELLAMKLSATSWCSGAWRLPLW